MTRVLLTGGAGYIGSACLRWMLKQGYDAYAYDNLSEGNRLAVPDHEHRLIEGDILDTDLFYKTLVENKIEVVMHFAAVASVPDSIKDPELYWRVNVMGTKSVLDAMVKAGVGKLVFSSTAATYSFDNDMPLQAHSSQVPKVPYGVTKLACESLIKDYAYTYDLGCTIMRYFNASGADPNGNYGEARRSESHLIPLVLYTALGKRDAIYVYGNNWNTPDGTCLRDFVHVDDISYAHELSISHIQTHQVDAFNIGLGKGTSVNEIISLSEEVVGKPINKAYKDRRPGDPGTLYTDPQKLISQLGWKPYYTNVKDIIETAWNWHVKNPEGYK